VRAAGDTLSRSVHDDLYIKALVLQSGGQAWALAVADLIGVDAQATERIRLGVAAQTGLKPEAITLCGTHTHSGPVVGAIGSAAQPDDLPTVRADGSLSGAYGQAPKAVIGTAYYAGETHPGWKEWFISEAIQAIVEAWQSRREAEVGFGQAPVEGVGASRRVLLSDGTWADPRRELPANAQVVSRTEVDPLVRVMSVRELSTGAPLAAVLNYGSHPWVFSTSAISAEIAGAAGAATNRVAAEWCLAGAAPPVGLFMAGPQGDITTIWNVDIQNVWKTWPDETQAASLARRERSFDVELQRLSHRLADSALAAIARIDQWEAAPALAGQRREIALPLKTGYRRPAEVLVAGWQQAAPEAHHLTEIQALRIGQAAIVALPGEPFVSLGRRLRAACPVEHLLIAAIANDYGPMSYLAEPADYELGGYELVTTPAAPSAGPTLIDGAIALLQA
jgi:hypothetical protein